MWLFLLNCLNVLFSKSNVMSRKFTIFRFGVISIFNPSKLKALMIFLCIFDVLELLSSGMKIRPSFLIIPPLLSLYFYLTCLIYRSLLGQLFVPSRMSL